MVTMRLLLALGIALFGNVTCEDTRATAKIDKRYDLSGGRSVFVMDSALPQEQVLSLKTFMATNDNWRYVLHDPHSVSKEHVYDDRNGIPWKSWQDSTLLRETDLGKTMKKVVDGVHHKSRNSTANFQLNEIYSALIRRGDRTNLVAEGSTDEEAYHVAIFMNIVWRKNAYGELLIYDDDGEILTAVRPKFGRIVIWHSSIQYIIRPPSIAQLATENVVMLQFGADHDTNLRKITFYKKFVDEMRRPPMLEAWLEEHKNADPAQLDMEKHLTLYRKNRRKHFVAVFDGLFNEDALSAIRAWTIKYGLYFFDGSLDASSDNVQWIAAINIHDFVKTDFWPIIHKIASHVSNSSDWYPYDVACNLIRSYDHTRFHLDTSQNREKEMTFLLYLSPNWTSVDYGETAFMETNDDHRYNEYVAEVVPTFGRAVIFDGNFPHSAHPPSVLHHHARYTLAVKLSYNKLIAIRKTFSEEKKHEPALPGSINAMSQMKQQPAFSVAMSKVRAVVDHLGTRNLQRQVSGAGFSEEQRFGRQQESDENEEPEGDEPAGENDGEGFQIEEFMEEMDAPLTPEQVKMVSEMVKYHKMNEFSQTEDRQQEDPILKHFDEEKRENSIQTWQKESGGDADTLSDYQELYLRQRLRLKDHAMGKMAQLL